MELWAELRPAEEKVQEAESAAKFLEQQQLVQGPERVLGLGWEQEKGQGVRGTEEAQPQVLWEVREVERCMVGGQVGAVVVVQAWGSRAGIQLGGSKEAVGASHSPLEAVQSLVVMASLSSFD